MQNGVINSQPGVPAGLVVTTSGYTFTDDQDNVEVYNANGVLLSITSRASIVQTVSYDTSGRFSGVSDSFGNTLTITRNSAGSIETVTMNGGQNVQYAYDGAGRLIHVTKLDGTTLQYQYGDSRWANGLTAVVDESGTTFDTWTYDAKERAITTQLAGGVGAHSLTYNPDGSLTDVDPLAANRTFSITRVGDTNQVSAISGSQCPSCAESAGTTYDAFGFVSSRLTTTATLPATRQIQRGTLNWSG
jgi:YD repeat-containing protein